MCTPIHIVYTMYTTLLLWAKGAGVLSYYFPHINFGIFRGSPIGGAPPPPRFSEFGEKAFQHFPYSKRCSSNNWSKLNISTITMLKNIIFYKKGLVLIDKTCLKHLILPLQNIKTNIGHHPKRAREHHLFCGPGNISTCHSHNAPDPLQQLASCTDT